MVSMSRFVLRYRGAGSAAPEDIARLRTLPDTAILDQTGRMLLVEAPETMSAALGEALPGWAISPERMVPVPTTRPEPRHEVAGPRP